MTIFDIAMMFKDLNEVRLKPSLLFIHESTFWELVREKDRYGNQYWEPNPEHLTMYGINVEVVTDDDIEGILVEIKHRPNEWDWGKGTND